MKVSASGPCGDMHEWSEAPPGTKPALASYLWVGD